MYSELVLNMADIDSTLALVINEHRKATAVLCAFLATGKDKVNIGITISDESLDTVQKPAALLLAPCCLEHNALKVRTCVGLSKVHGHGLTGANTRDELLPLLLATELVKGLGATLEAPDVLEA